MLQKKLSFFTFNSHFHPRIIHKYFTNTTLRNTRRKKQGFTRARYRLNLI
jgi:hypothetical protein